MGMDPCNRFRSKLHTKSMENIQFTYYAIAYFLFYGTHVWLLQLRQSEPAVWPSECIRRRPRMTEFVRVQLSYSRAHAGSRPATECRRISAASRSLCKTTALEDPPTLSNRRPSTINSSRGRWPTQTECTSTVQRICRTIESHRCRRPSIVRRTVCRKRQSLPTEWPMCDDPCRWWRPASHLTARIIPRMFVCLAVHTKWAWIAVLASTHALTHTNLPNAAKMPAAQNTSPHSAGRKSKPPIRSPNESCNGSNMVM